MVAESKGINRNLQLTNGLVKGQKVKVRALPEQGPEFSPDLPRLRVVRGWRLPGNDEMRDEK